jgi:3-phenylpropionate/trans-cinnamate dioxygenase ferredoxin subunit
VTLTRICAAADIEPNSANRFVVDGVAIALVRIDDDFYAIGDRCSHADVSLSEGEIDPGDRHIECWKHGSRFSLETGEPDCLPATKPVPVFAVKVDGGDVYLEVGAP